MSQAPIAPTEVLAQLDKASEDFDLPDLGHGYSNAIDARAHAYSDRTRWALIIETVGYNPRAGNIVDVLYVFGNCLTIGTPGPENDDFLDRIDNMDDVESEDLPERSLLNVVVVRGVEIDLGGRPGEDLVDVFRRLTPDHRSLLLADEQELKRRIPADLPEVLRLDEWHQTDIFETRPSSSEFYRQMAEVVSTADPHRYQPTLPANTYWSNWPESGSL